MSASVAVRNKLIQIENGEVTSTDREIERLAQEAADLFDPEYYEPNLDWALADEIADTLDGRVVDHSPTLSDPDVIY